MGLRSSSPNLLNDLPHPPLPSPVNTAGSAATKAEVSPVHPPSAGQLVFALFSRGSDIFHCIFADVFRMEDRAEADIGP